jgi:transposase
MLSWPPTVRIYLCAAATDMRKGFDSLADLVQSTMALDPMTGHLFVFRSRRGDRLKVLWWDRDGFCLWYKRLERGSFRFPACAGATVEVKAADLAMILEGIDPASVRRRPRYSRPPVDTTA